MLGVVVQDIFGFNKIDFWVSHGITWTLPFCYIRMFVSTVSPTF